MATNVTAPSTVPPTCTNPSSADELPDDVATGRVACRRLAARVVDSLRERDDVDGLQELLVDARACELVAAINAVAGSTTDDRHALLTMKCAKANADHHDAELAAEAALVRCGLSAAAARDAVQAAIGLAAVTL